MKSQLVIVPFVSTLSVFLALLVLAPCRSQAQCALSADPVGADDTSGFEKAESTTPRCFPSRVAPQCRIGSSSFDETESRAWYRGSRDLVNGRGVRFGVDTDPRIGAVPILRLVRRDMSRRCTGDLHETPDGRLEGNDVPEQRDVSPSRTAPRLD